MGRRKGAKAGSEPAEAPVLALRMDGSTGDAPREEAAPGGYQTPCTLTGLGAGLSSGSLGWVFGFGGYWLKNMRKGQFKASLAEGWGSAKTFAIMGGLYAAVSCFMVRLRQKNDAWNGAASGCATGLALGWKQGPMGALQSCAMLGFFSYFVDGMTGSPAEAATHGSGSGSGEGSQREAAKQRGPIELLLSPAVPLLAAQGSMGQQPSKDTEEIQRLEEIRSERNKAWKLQMALAKPEAAEEVAGSLAPFGSARWQALFDSVLDYSDRLEAERHAICVHLAALRAGRPSSMPDPTPPLGLSPPPPPGAQVAPAPAPPACGVQPSTPVGSASPLTGQRGDSSSNEEGAHAGDAERSEVVPLLPARAEGLARGLRRQQGRHEGG
ncbi:mitochondrial import inner membrane translocase subunit TIM22-2-like [Micractinium conductrix]|uniref:Mitochondrial import inner membrane translocase subunit TIM22-2-like n=1 Tax=Micractinium conductrix TaxID=554055 RepID=A0A2P6VIX2_9CHLO|nr:mitochondrial import inner membrane translocase subunit TIM22-2-like [Micractinium conductrix]|eukprot:PSC74053.1 mitochondrial import inner membrane translocase subunit TIM22-2-like [Micractinium conductrix]